MNYMFCVTDRVTMRHFALATLSLLVLLAGCSANDYDLMATSSVKSRFHDKEPIDFGHDNPHKRDVHGIDVSKWNGHINWKAVKRSGVDFAFIKATEGKDVVDPRFGDYWRGARSAGLAHAPYHFYYFCSTPDQQADWFIANVPKESMSLPPVLDVEWNPTSKTCRHRPEPNEVRAQLQRFLDRLEGYYGKRPIIYTSVDFHEDNLNGYFQNYHFWVRSVAAPPSKTFADRRWAFWQYTSTGVIPGIDSETDINVFAGSRANWNNWVASTR